MATIHTGSPGISKQKCRERRIFNDYNFTCQEDPARRVPVIDYTSDLGRGGRGQHWSVWRVGDNLDAVGRDEGYTSPYYVSGGGIGSHETYTRREFALGWKGTFPETKQAALDAALAWASDYFGVTEWAKTPFGGYAPADFVAARVAEIKRGA